LLANSLAGRWKFFRIGSGIQVRILSSAGFARAAQNPYLFRTTSESSLAAGCVVTKINKELTIHNIYGSDKALLK
jgi:hypothetical protein